MGNQQPKPEQGKVQRLNVLLDRYISRQEDGKRLAVRNGKLPIKLLLKQLYAKYCRKLLAIAAYSRYI